MRRKNEQYELSQILTSLPVFIENYNKSVPLGFYQATSKMLVKFQELHPMLFKKGDAWSMEKHRKRVMDWLFSNHENA